jgi:hypothetical protein
METANKKYVVIHLRIDQQIPEDKVDETINQYIDVLSRAGGDLTWNCCDWDTFDV